jgi:hypothetical protein
LDSGSKENGPSEVILVFFEMDDFFVTYLPLKLTFVSGAEIEECA